jgi:hypothetical protein
METIRPFENKEFKYLDSTHGFVNIALGNGTMFQVGFIRNEGSFFIGIMGKGAYTFSHFAHWDYVANKLNLLEGDARNLADFINTQVLALEGFNKQGYYNLDCCIKLS